MQGSEEEGVTILFVVPKSPMDCSVSIHLRLRSVPGSCIDDRSSLPVALIPLMTRSELGVLVGNLFQVRSRSSPTSNIVHQFSGGEWSSQSCWPVYSLLSHPTYYDRVRHSFSHTRMAWEVTDQPALTYATHSPCSTPCLPHFLLPLRLASLHGGFP